MPDNKQYAGFVVKIIVLEILLMIVMGKNRNR